MRLQRKPKLRIGKRCQFQNLIIFFCFSLLQWVQQTEAIFAVTQRVCQLAQQLYSPRHPSLQNFPSAWMQTVPIPYFQPTCNDFEGLSTQACVAQPLLSIKWNFSLCPSTWECKSLGKKCNVTQLIWSLLGLLVLSLISFSGKVEPSILFCKCLLPILQSYL